MDLIHDHTYSGDLRFWETMNIIGAYIRKLFHKIIELSTGTNVDVLENKSVVIDDVTFHGTILWTNFELGDPTINGSICQSKMNDCKLIPRDPSYSRVSEHICSYLVGFINKLAKNIIGLRCRFNF